MESNDSLSISFLIFFSVSFLFLNSLMFLQCYLETCMNLYAFANPNRNKTNVWLWTDIEHSKFNCQYSLNTPSASGEFYGWTCINRRGNMTHTSQQVSSSPLLENNRKIGNSEINTVDWFSSELHLFCCWRRCLVWKCHNWIIISFILLTTWVMADTTNGISLKKCVEELWGTHWHWKSLEQFKFKTGLPTSSTKLARLL